jgi:hypothetical protein
MFYEWGHSDSTRPAHLLRTKRRDDCNAASSGDRQEYVYDAEGLVTEICGARRFRERLATA